MFNQSDLLATLPRLQKFALRLTRNQSDAQDLLQSTVLRALEKKHLFQEGTELFSWTSKIMFNIFASGYRRKTRFESQYDPETVLQNQSVEGNQEVMCDLKRVNSAIGLLSPDHRAVLMLVCVKGMPYEDVAQALSVPIGTVRSRLSRARSSLQNVLAPRTTALPAVANASIAKEGSRLRA